MRRKNKQFFVMYGLFLLFSLESQAGLVREGEDESFQWLDRDKKVYVLQNRKYLKTGQFFLSALGGMGLSSPYTSSYQVEPRLSFYFLEAWGIELFYSFANNKKNSTYASLELTNPNVLPIIREIQNQYGATIHFVPWYAKIHVFETILYFDWYFGAGAGQIKAQIDTRVRVTDFPSYVGQKLFGLFCQTGQVFYFSSHWVARWDLTGSFYRAPLGGLTGLDAWFSNYNISFGLGWSPG